MHLLLESLGDPIIKILLIALAIKVVVLFRDFDWYETIGILIAIFLASFISSISEYGSEKAFSRLQEEQLKTTAKVRRSGKIIEIPSGEIVVGDIVMLSSGDKIPADKKSGIEQALQQLKDAHKAGDAAAIDSAINNLNTVMQAASQQMYQGGQQAGPQGAQGGQQAQGGNDGAQDVQDADFEEVK